MQTKPSLVNPKVLAEFETHQAAEGCRRRALWLLRKTIRAVKSGAPLPAIGKRVPVGPIEAIEELEAAVGDMTRVARGLVEGVLGGIERATREHSVHWVHERAIAADELERMAPAQCRIGWRERGSGGSARYGDWFGLEMELGLKRIAVEQDGKFPMRVHWVERSR